MAKGKDADLDQFLRNVDEVDAIIKGLASNDSSATGKADEFLQRCQQNTQIANSSAGVDRLMLLVIHISYIDNKSTQYNYIYAHHPLYSLDLYPSLLLGVSRQWLRSITCAHTTSPLLPWRSTTTGAKPDLIPTITTPPLMHLSLRKQV